jgi:hypothetical protein
LQAFFLLLQIAEKRRAKEATEREERERDAAELVRALLLH